MKEEMTEFIQKQKTAFVASVDEEGFPNIKAMFMPRKIEGNCFYFSRGRKIFCVYGEKSSLIRTRYV